MATSARKLWSVLVAAVGAHGCGGMCFMSTPIPARAYTRRVALLPNAPTTGPEGKQTCERACGEDTHCEFATELPRRADGLIAACTYESGATRFVQPGGVPTSVLDHLGPEGAVVDSSTCRDCYEVYEGVLRECRLFPSAPQLPLGQDAVCHRIEPAHCYDGGRKMGRAPAGLAALAPPRSARAYYARMAALEAASVLAFERLAGELHEHGAPGLARGAARAARDEARHARVAHGMAQARGGRGRTVPVPSPVARGLFELARENVNEGCVGETLGAALLIAQAGRARGLERKRLLAIARDEVRHAALSFRIHAFARARLDARERRRLDAGLEAALAAARALPHDVPRAVARAVGLPSRAEARTLFVALAGAIREAAV